MRVAVIDGQGGGIGKVITAKLRKEFGESIEIICFGTNSLATAAMLKAGANEGATGENAIARNMPEMDVITGSVGIVVANSMLGELTPLMAQAIADSKARKILLPINKCDVEIAGVKQDPLPHQIDAMITLLRENGRKNHV